MGLGGVAIAVPPYVIHPKTTVLGRAGGLRGDCPWIKQPLFLIYRFAVSFPQKTFAAIVWPVDYQG